MQKSQIPMHWNDVIEKTKFMAIFHFVLAEVGENLYESNCSEEREEKTNLRGNIARGLKHLAIILCKALLLFFSQLF